MMKHSTYTSYDELPLMLSVAEVTAVLGQHIHCGHLALNSLPFCCALDRR